ncbi:MAG: hypothetical protein Q7R96_05900 [Nanoarchaeota archaeon]|nr:hypothetical protein [Nanoarchaeota archaeon]
MHELLSEELSDIARHTSLLLPTTLEEQQLTPAFDYTINSYDLEKVIRGILKPHHHHLTWYSKKMTTLRREGNNENIECRRAVSSIQFTLHELVVDLLVEGLETCFYYVERAPVGKPNRGEKMPDILCQYPRLPLHVPDLEQPETVYSIGRFKIALIEVKTGKPSGAKKQLIDYHKHKIGTDKACARMRYSTINHRIMTYPRMK